MSRSNEASQGDTFNAAPRVVKPKKKYREPEEEEDEEMFQQTNAEEWPTTTSCGRRGS